MLFAINSTNVRNILSHAGERMALQVAARVAPEAAVERAARLFSTPPRFPQSRAAREALAAGTRFEVRAGELSLMAWRFGRIDHPVVLLSHGWGGRGAQLRHFVKPLADAGFQPVLFDHVGHGDSGGVRSTLPHFIDGLDAVARHLESRGARVHGVVGHSLGAAAAAAWLASTGRDARAVVFAPPASIVRASTHFARRLGLPETIRRDMQQRFERAMGRPWSDFELPHSLRGVRAPALVVHDVEDRDVPIASGLAVARAWPGARFLATRHLGHAKALRDPQSLRDAVDFLAARVAFAPPAQAGGAAFGAPAPLY